MNILDLVSRQAAGGTVEQRDNGWRLSLPAGPGGQYRLAQLDDYESLPRRRFPWYPPVELRLQARASENDLPGTWGFGLWNDPFGAGLAHGGTRALPTLPEAAWFFFASGQNNLSFRNDQPANGPLAGALRSTALPLWALLPAAPLAAGLWCKPWSRLLRRGAARLVQEDWARVGGDLTAWHQYRIRWREVGLQFLIDDEVVLETVVAPRPPLGLVLWIDNQYAAWNPNGGLEYGTLENQSGWIEISDLTIGEF